MKKVALSLIVFLFAVPAVYAGDGVIHKVPGREVVKDSYIAVFNLGTNPAALADQLARTHGARVGHVYRYALQGAHFNMTEGQAQGMAHNPHVSYLVQDSLSHIAGDQANPTWGLDRIDQRNLPLDNNYHYDYTGTGVKAFILDTGIYTAHVDFGGRASWGIDCTGEGVYDGHGHGTHVSGTVGGATWGVAKNVDLIAVKICNSGGWCPSSAIMCGIDYVTQQKVADPTTPMVANMSIGGPYDPTENAAVNNSVAEGVFYAVAAGNNNANACNYSPASAADAYTLGATTSTDARSSFSNWGPCVDIFAPGSAITSAWNDGGTAVLSGTSMASPHACGAGALVFDEHPGWTAYQVMDELTARGTEGVISNPGTGSPNLLLYTLGGCTPTSRTEVNCSDGIDDDCDGLIDGADPDCDACGKRGDRCRRDKDCCPGLTCHPTLYRCW